MLIALAFSVTFLSTSGISAKPSGMDKFKAATILNMIKYIDIGKENNLKICISGDKEIESIIENYLAKKTVGKISNVESIDSTSSSIETCDFIFLSSSNPRISSSIIDAIENSNNKAVTISDIDNFIKRTGGLVEIYEENGKIRFSINLKKAKFDNIKINSKLIETANKIY